MLPKIGMMIPRINDLRFAKTCPHAPCFDTGIYGILTLKKTASNIVNQDVPGF
jgi:hypothetical protein